MKCLKNGSWVTSHITATHTPKLGEIKIARITKNKETRNPKRQKQAPITTTSTPATTVAHLAATETNRPATRETLQTDYDRAATNLNKLRQDWNRRQAGGYTQN